MFLVPIVVVMKVCLVVAEPIDQHATAETKALFDRLRDLAKDPGAILFGHHKTTLNGAGGGHSPYKTHTISGHVSWEFTTEMAKSGAADSLSDVKAVTGQYPAMTGFDFYQLDNDWMTTVGHLTKLAYARGMVVTMAWHVNNFGSGGNAWDMGGTHVLRNLLPGGHHHNHFTALLDKMANYANNLRDGSGKLIPLIFRPLHESNGNWFWWGLHNSQGNTADDLKEVYRYIVRYLRDTRHVHNFLYAYSPDASFDVIKEDGHNKAYLEAYPGDDYVDIWGVDDYSHPHDSGKLQKFVDELGMLVTEAEKRYKIPALTEVGFGKNGIDRVHDFWLDHVLNTIKGTAHVRKNAAAARIAFMYTWASRCGSTCEYFIPYPGHPAQDDFRNFSHDPVIKFADFLKGHDMYHH